MSIGMLVLSILSIVLALPIALVEKSRGCGKPKYPFYLLLGAMCVCSAGATWLGHRSARASECARSEEQHRASKNLDQMGKRLDLVREDLGQARDDRDQMGKRLDSVRDELREAREGQHQAEAAQAEMSEKLSRAEADRAQMSEKLQQAETAWKLANEFSSAYNLDEEKGILTLTLDKRVGDSVELVEIYKKGEDEGKRMEPSESPPTSADKMCWQIDAGSVRDTPKDRAVATILC